MTERIDWSPELAAGLKEVGTAALSTALRSRGYIDSVIEGVKPLRPGMRTAGRARTLRLVPTRPDLAAMAGGAVNNQKLLYDALDPDDVLVVDARGVQQTATLGDVLALRALTRGAAAVVTDGGVRDSSAVAEIGLPVYAATTHPVVVGRRHVPWETDVVVACGGAAVVPGDVIVGDDDGVLVIPAPLVAGVLADAQKQEREDAWILRRVAEGEQVVGLFPMNATWRQRYEEDPEA